MDTLGKAMNELNATPEHVERMLKIGFVAWVATPDELAQRLKKEEEVYRDWVKRIGFKLE